MSNARFRFIAEGVVFERVATRINIDYDPVTAAANIAFQMDEVLNVNGVPQELKGSNDVLRYDFAQLAARCFGAGVVDPVTGINLEQVSGAGMMLLFKAAVDALDNERAAAAQAEE